MKRAEEFECAFRHPTNGLHVPFDYNDMLRVLTGGDSVRRRF